MLALLLLVLSARPGAATPPAGFSNLPLAIGLSEPIAVDFLPDGRMLIAERAGTVLLSHPPYFIVEPTPVLSLSNLKLDDFGNGLLNLLVDPDFAANGYFYLFYTADTSRHRIARFTFDEASGVAPPASEVVIWQDHVDHGEWHYGGAMAFGPDGAFYFTTGDNFHQEPGTIHASQDPTRSWGKLHRILLLHDGSGAPYHPYYLVPPDNPFWDGFGPNYDEIYAMGLRNPFQMAFDASGRLYIGDVGGNEPETAWEEIHVGRRKANYGWPLCEGFTCRAGVKGMDDPLFAYSHELPDVPGDYTGAAIVAGFVYEGGLYPPEYQNAFFYGDYARQYLRYFTMDGAGEVVADFPFEPADGAMRAPGIGDVVKLVMGPDGALYYVDIGILWGGEANPEGGSVHRIDYSGSDNQPPQVQISIGASQGLPPFPLALQVDVDDPDGDPLTYLWDFGNGDTSSEVNPAYVYHEKGAYTVRLLVFDGTVWSSSNRVHVIVGEPPTATITAPADGIFFRAGDSITYRGEGLDPDGSLTEDNFSWQVNLVHDAHLHPFVGPQCCQMEGSFVVEEVGHSWTGETAFEIILTVTDDDGISARDSVTIYPDKVQVGIDTAPSGLEITFDELTSSTPFVREVLIGAQHNLVAEPLQWLGNTLYAFLAWNDSPLPTRQITIPDTDSAYLAIYLSLCPAELVLSGERQRQGQEDLDLLRQVRDSTLSTSGLGRRYRSHYDAQGPTIVSLLLADVHLRNQGAAVLRRFLPGLAAMEAGLGERVVVSRQMVDELLAFLDALALRARAEGREDLVRVLDQERARIDWDSLAGNSFEKAWNTMSVQDAGGESRLYLPSLRR